MQLPTDPAPAAQLDYLETYFESVRNTFNARKELGGLSKSSAKHVLVCLQQAMHTLEAAGFDQLGQRADSST